MMQKLRDRVQLVRKDTKSEVPEMEAKKVVAPPPLKIDISPFAGGGEGIEYEEDKPKSVPKKPQLEAGIGIEGPEFSKTGQEAKDEREEKKAGPEGKPEAAVNVEGSEFSQIKLPDESGLTEMDLGLGGKPEGGEEEAAEAEEAEKERVGIDGMPMELQEGLEAILGVSFAGVRIKANSAKAVEVGALAFAKGNEVHFAPGQYQPNTVIGLQLIGHEFTHLAQQRKGAVKATKQVGGMGINDDAVLEEEAERMGAMVAAKLKGIDWEAVEREDENKKVEKDDEEEKEDDGGGEGGAGQMKVEGEGEGESVDGESGVEEKSGEIILEAGRAEEERNEYVGQAEEIGNKEGLDIGDTEAESISEEVVGDADGLDAEEKEGEEEKRETKLLKTNSKFQRDEEGMDSRNETSARKDDKDIETDSSEGDLVGDSNVEEKELEIRESEVVNRNEENAIIEGIGGDVAQLAEKKDGGRPEWYWSSWANVVPNITWGMWINEKALNATYKVLGKTHAPDWLKNGIKLGADINKVLRNTILDINGEVIKGAILGDFIKEPSLLNMVGQIAMGFVPYVGIVADIRDTVAAVIELCKEEGWKKTSNWVNLVFALIGVIPGIGDLAKAAKKLYKLKSIEKMLGSLAPMFKGIEEGWAKVDKFLRPKIDIFTTQVKERWQNFKKSAQRRANEFVRGTVNKYDQAKGWLKSKWTGLETSFKEGLSKVKTAAREGVRRVTNRLNLLNKQVGNWAQKKIQGLISQVRQVWDQGKALVPKIKLGVGRILGRLGNGMRKLVEDVVEKVKGKLNPVAKVVKPVIKKVVAKIRPIVKQVWKEVKDEAGDLVEDVRPIVKKVVNKMGAAGGYVWNQAKHGIEKVLEEVGPSLKVVLEKARKVVKIGTEVLPEKIKVEIVQAVNTVRSGVDRVSEYVQDKWRKLNPKTQKNLKEGAEVVEEVGRILLEGKIVDTIEELEELQDKEKEKAGTQKQESTTAK